MENITTITRKKRCPTCQGSMTMDIDENGYPAHQGMSAGIWMCQAGHKIVQTNDDEEE